MAMYRVRCQLSGSLITGPAVSTFWFDQAGGTAQQAVTAVQAFWESLDNHVQESINIASEPDVAFVDETTGETTGYITTTPFSDAGETAQANTSRDTQGIVQLRTGTFVGGKEVRGRIFIPGVPAGDVTNGMPASGYKTALTTAGDALVANATSLWVVYSRVHHDMYPVAGTTVPSYFGSLRTRRD